MRKNLVLLLIISFILLSLPGCESEGIDTSRKAEINIFYQLMDIDSAAGIDTSAVFMEAKRIFEEKYKNITVNLEPFVHNRDTKYYKIIEEKTVSDEKMDIFIVADTVEDIYFNFEGPDMFDLNNLTFSTDGPAMPLDNLIKKNQAFFDSVYDEGVLSKVETDGVIYKLPISYEANAMFYNKDIIKKYNISLSTGWTWNDYFKACSTINNAGVNPIPDDYYRNMPSLGAYLNSFGMDIFNKKLSKSNITNPTFLEAVNFEEKMFPLEISKVGAFNVGGLNSGAFAFYASYISLSKYVDMQQTLPNIDITNLPNGNGEGFSRCKFSYACINQKSTVQKEAFEFIKVLISEELQNKLTFSGPVNKNVIKKLYSRIPEEKQKIFEYVYKTSKPYSQTSKSKEATDFIIGSIQDEIHRKLQAENYEIHGKLIDETFLKELDKEVDKVLAK